VKGKNCYVWVLASMEQVAYFYTPTREGATIRAMLKDFSGVLVSDFYAAYDTIKCPQQKCLIHFIRDLNDDLLKHPYDDELKLLVGDFAGLVKPMVETVNRRGLKKRFLRKHRIFVDRFYKRLGGGFGAGEPALKIIERLQKNRNTMFTFLDFDDVPWNNNNAEHAVKAFATLRRVIDGPTTEEGLRDYLILLSLCETCKYKNVESSNFCAQVRRTSTISLAAGGNSVSGEQVRGSSKRLSEEALYCDREASRRFRRPCLQLTFVPAVAMHSR
jgi:hypothetical protein